MMKIGRGIFINEERFEFRFSRSSGPGGQNVNKVNTRVTLFFDVAGCEELSSFQKKRILERLSSRANKDGVVRVVSQKYRSQNQNKEAAVDRLRELLGNALKRKKVRRRTKVPLAAKRKRLENKRQRAELKKQRIKVKLTGQ